MGRRSRLVMAGTGAAGLGLLGGWYSMMTAEAKEKDCDLKLQYAFRKARAGDLLNIIDCKNVLKSYYDHFTWMDVTDAKCFRALFDSHDMDGDGLITRCEMNKMLSKLNGHSTSVSYSIIAGPGMEGFAEKLVNADPDRFTYFPTSWGKFPDKSDNIVVGGFQPVNRIRDENILFLGSFHNNDVTLSQMYVITMLAESFPKDLTILLPFYPTATMERVTKEGTCATASTLARFFGGLPSSGRPHRVMVYDLHTLQNRFYLSGNSLATLHTAFPLILDKIPSTNIDCVAFPDDGAEKRFRSYFKQALPDLQTVVCGKKRDPFDPLKRSVVIKDGDCKGKNVLIIDDMVQSGGTLVECGKVLKKHGAESVNAFVTHGIFPRDSYKRFLKDGDRSIFDKFFVTNSNPTVIADIPEGDCFEVLDMTDLVVKDL